LYVFSWPVGVVSPLPEPGSSGSRSPGGLVVEVEGVRSVVVVGWIVVVVDTAWAAYCSVPELLSPPKAPTASAMTTSSCQR
jgi:hypothetical protein